MNILSSLGLTQTQSTLFVLFSALWILPWKAVALWKASQNGHKWWFATMFIINTLGLIEIYYIFFGADHQLTKDYEKEQQALSTGDHRNYPEDKDGDGEEK